MSYKNIPPATYANPFAIDDFRKEKSMNNFQKITQMTEDELATYLYLFYINDCNNCPVQKYDYKQCYQEKCDCITLIEKWLKRKNEIGVGEYDIE